MITKKLLTILLLFTTVLGFAQRYTISGYISDKKNGEKLIGANVYNAETNKGGATNAYGFYSVSFPQGRIKLMVSYVGYNSYMLDIDLKKNLTLNIELDPSISIEEVVVTGEKSGMNLRGTQMSTIEVPMKTLESLPSFMGEPDIIKGIQLLPGVQSGSEGMSGLYVRGGGPDQNLILLDGVPVYNVNHLFGFFSVFNPDAIQNAKLVKGGFPARYGGRLSSVLDISMKEGNTKEFKGSASIGIIASKATIEGPIGDNASFILSGRRTYIDVLAWPFIKMAQASEGAENLKAGYYFYDLNGKINYKINDKSRVYLSMYTGKDRFYTGFKDTYEYDEYVYDESSPDYNTYATHRSESESDMQLWWGNITGALRWNYQISNKLFSNTTITYSRFKMLTGFEMSDESYINDTKVDASHGEFNYNSGINDLTAKIDFDYYPVNNHQIKFGVSTINHTFNPGVVILKATQKGSEEFSDSFGNSEIKSNEADIYIEDDMKIGSRLKMNVGIHGSAYFLKGKEFFSIQPRFGARYQWTEKLSTKVSFAKMDQYIHLLTNSNIGLPTDLWVPATANVPPMAAWQGAAGFMYELPYNLEFSVEGYYKLMNDVSGYKDGANFMSLNDSWENKQDKGTGWSYGIEALLMRSIGKTTGWIGYTWSRAIVQFPEQIYSDPYPFKYDRPHDLSFVLTHKFSERVDVGLTWIYGTGYPVTLGTQEYPTYESMQQKASNPYSDYSWSDNFTDIKHKNNYRMPDYHRLDVSVNLHKQHKKFKTTWAFAVYNAYNRKNAFYIDWATKHGFSGKPETGLFKYSIFPIMPSVAFKIQF
jgi:hypothetical protein